MSNRLVVTRSVHLRRGGVDGNAAGPIFTIEAMNKSGASVAKGDVVVVDKTSNSTADIFCFTTSAVAKNPDVFGMALETIADATVGEIQVYGPTTALKVDGTTDISIGDYISTSGTAKIGAKTAGTGAFALALEAYTTDDQSGVIDAFICNLDWIKGNLAKGTLEIANGETIDFNATAAAYAAFLRDVNGNELLDTQGVASALNQFGISNAATGNGPILEARGETNVDINLLAKGTGAVIINNGTDPVQLKLMGAAGGFNNEITDLSGLELLGLQGVASAVNEFTITNAAANGAPRISVQGDDTNIDHEIDTKGTGKITLMLGGDEVLRLHDASGMTFSAAAATAGHAGYLQSEDGGSVAADAAGNAGGLLEIRTGDGTAGGAHTTNNPAGAAGGALTIATGAGGTGGASGTGAGGDGGAFGLTAGAGANAGAGGNGAGGAGATVTLTAGAGGNGVGSGNGGAGGDIAFVPGAAGTNGTPGAAGLVKFNTAGQWTANSTGSVSITNVAPALAETSTISKWLTVKDDSGTVMFIPAWT